MRRSENHTFADDACTVCGFTDLEAVAADIHRRAELGRAEKVMVKLRGEQNLLRENEFNRLKKLEEYGRIAVVLAAAGHLDLLRPGQHQVRVLRLCEYLRSR